MDAGQIIYRITGDNSDLNRSLNNTSSLAQKSLKIAESSVKAFSVALSSAGAGLSALAKESIEAYADYEQLIGGVETLFKTSADTIKKYAEDSYVTAGISANDYMRQVTSFSASMIASLNGDTQKSAELSNQAIIDMSDNANKMGSSLQSIQDAYQGFAKGNFTMLDNLKLGFGGTKQEMERLLETAEKVQKSKGIDQALDINSFADITQAIHVIQDEMGITGTTAKEASETISGSINMLKASWQNLMVGFADDNQDLGKLIDNVVDSLSTVMDNLMPRLEQILPNISNGITELSSEILPMIPEVLNALLPALTDGASQLISVVVDTLVQLARVIADNIPMVVDSAINLIEQLSEIFRSNAMSQYMSESAIGIVNSLIDGIDDAIPLIVESASAIITGLAEFIRDNLDDIVDGAVGIVQTISDTIYDTIPDLLPTIVELVIQIVEQLLQSVTDNLDKVIDSAVKIITALAEGLLNSVDILLAKAPELVLQLAEAIINARTQLAEVPIKLVQQIADGLVNHDWTSTAQAMMDGLISALDEAQKKVQVWLDNTFNNGALYGGDINNVESSDFVKNMQAGAEVVVSGIDTVTNSISEAYNQGKEILGIATEDYSKAYVYDYEKADETAQAVLDKYKDKVEKWKESQGEFTDAVEDSASSLYDSVEGYQDIIDELDKKLALRQITEEDYWSQRLATLERFRDEEDSEWVKLYDKTMTYYEKLADTEAKAQQKANEKAQKEQEKEQAKQQALVEKRIKSQISDIEKAYNSVVKARDSLESAMALSWSDLASSTKMSITDKRTGAVDETVTNKLAIEEFEKKLKAKRQLPSLIAKLIEADTPQSMIEQLLKLDPAVALDYINQLLASPQKLNQIISDFKEDDSLSKTLADMVIESSDDFEKLGTDAGTLFGESFIEEFKKDWKESLKNILDDDELYKTLAEATLTANATAGNVVATTTAQAVASQENTATVTAGTTPTATANANRMIVVDADGKYVATLVNDYNKANQVQGGK